ncbi:MAG: DNA-processing protein DprA, partial [Tannerella sp.]|nr:DNA-processing protein DprA [Tannerella sp.]
KGVGDVLARQLIQYFGTAADVFKAKRPTLEKVQGIGSVTAEMIAASRKEALLKAEKELVFVEKNKIRIYCITDADYPVRLKECQDAPVVFYFKGNADLNAAKIISIVGTRRCTDYGRQHTEELIKDLSVQYPNLLIVSGLAYGIDICAHRNALKNKLPTVGVLAHGLDRIYPPLHRNAAIEMLDNGGLLTDFMSGTIPDKENFLRRNRLIAGLADVTIVVESAVRGGSLVTADIAVSYGRDVYAFPGRTSDMLSGGCNRLIRMNKAGLITSAEDLIKALCWDIDLNKVSKNVQPELFAKSDHPVICTLQSKGEIQINILAAELNMPVHKLSSMLFELELEGLIRSYPGGIYKLN